MLLPRRILPSDTLENGFRVAHNETVDAMPDYSQCQVTDAGLLQFYNDLGQFIGEVDLSAVYQLQSDASGGGVAPQFYSASETQEGVGKIASADAVVAGENQYDWVTPATLEYAFSLLKQELGDAAGKPLDALITDAAAQFVGSLPAVPGSDATAPENNLLGFGLLYKKPDGSLGIKRMLGNDAWAYLARQATESELRFFAANKVRPFLSISALLRDNPYVDQTPYLTGANANLFFHKNKADGPWTDRGLVFLEQDGTQNLFRSIIGFTGLYNFFQIDGVRQLKAYYDRVLVEVDLKAKGNVLAQSFSTSSVPLAGRLDYLPVGVKNSAGGVDIQFMARSNYIATLGLASDRPVPVSREILCYDKYDAQSGPVTVPPGSIGVSLAHTLHLPGAQIFGRVSYPDGSYALGYSLTYPDADHFRVDYAGATGETSDLIIELYKRTS